MLIAQGSEEISSKSRFVFGYHHLTLSVGEILHI